MAQSPHVRAIAIIPARLASERFPRKVLADATGKPMVVHVAEAARQARTIERVVIACDCQEIVDAVVPHGIECLLTDPEHPNGTARVAEAARAMGIPEDIAIVNVQGDEPEIEPETIDAAAQALFDRGTPVATIGVPFGVDEDPKNPNIVKLVCNTRREAMYFSRSPIPYGRDSTPSYYKHVGLYAYRRSFLEIVGDLEPTRLELAEKLEQLRFLEHGYAIAVARAEASCPGIDTPEQYEAFVDRYRERANSARA